MATNTQFVSIETGTVLAGRYVIDRRLGSGGMGQVYLAAQRPFHRPIVIKVMHGRLLADEQMKQRFFNEARASAQLSHPNTITVHDFGVTEDGLYFIAMEYVEGHTLRTVLSEEGRLSMERAIPIVVQVAQSLGEAHRKGIIHRDLKPENVMISRLGDQEEIARVLDFGIAKLTDRKMGLTQTGSIFGTPGYMAPEQAREGGEVGATADLYSLTCCLYEMLTGRMPFEADTPLKVIMKHQSAPVPSLGGEFPRMLDAFVRRGLAKVPEDRPAVAEDYVAGLLECFVDREDEPSPQHTPSFERSGSSVRASSRSGELSASPGTGTPVPVAHTDDADDAPYGRSTVESPIPMELSSRHSEPPELPEDPSASRERTPESDASARASTHGSGGQPSVGSARDSHVPDAFADTADARDSVAESDRLRASGSEEPAGTGSEGLTSGINRSMQPFTMGVTALALVCTSVALTWVLMRDTNARENEAAPAVAAPRSGAATAAAGQTTAPSGAPDTVELAVESRPPDAVITVDGQRVGFTPTTIALSPDRTTRVSVEKEGYETEVYEKLSPSRVSGGKLVVPLEPRTLTLHVTSPVPGAELRVGGTSHGKLPADRERDITVRWPDDQLELVITHPDFEDYRENIPVEALGDEVELAPDRADLVERAEP